MSDDYAKDTTTTGSVAVGGTAAGTIETGNDFDWFRVELVSGKTYVIDLEGSDSGGGTLDSTVLRGLYDADGARIAGTQTNDGGDGDDARLMFTASESGTYYIAARGYASTTGTYTVRVTETVSDDTRDGATDLFDITDLGGPRFPRASLDGEVGEVDYFRFTLSEAKEVGLGLRQLDADADLILEDAEGRVLHRSEEDGTANEWIRETLLAGTYYVRVEAQEAGENAYRLRYGVSDADPEKVAALEAAQEGDTNEAPAFAETSYAFDLAENADGSTDRVALGSVLASDPEGAALTYSIAEGNDADLFEIDASTGALSYKGTGEDHESETTSYALTVRASDGSLHADTTVTVSVTDVAEAPAFAETSYAFDLAENADGSTDRVALGSVLASDPEGAALTYSIAEGNDADLFEIDASTGALSYKGTGEDHESETTSYALTVRASDGTLHADATVTISVTDVDEAPAFAQASYAFDLAENADGSTDRVALGSVLASDPEGTALTYSIAEGNDADLFAIDASTGALSYKGTGEDHESDTTSYALTVRASDGTLHADTTVTVSVTDVVEETEAPIVQLQTALQTVSEPDGEDFSEDSSTRGRVVVGESATGEIDYDRHAYSISEWIEAVARGLDRDRDWFAVELEAGRLYQFDLEGSDTDGGSLSDPYLYGIHDSDGNRIAGTQNNRGGEGDNSRVFFNATEGGTYYVSAGGYRYYEGTYTLSVNDVTDEYSADFTADTGTAGVVAVGGSTMSKVDYDGDRDWFAVELEAGKLYRFDLKGSTYAGGTEDGTLSDPYLYGIHDAEGNRIDGTTDDHDGVGWNSQVFFSANEGGTYYVSAGANRDNTGTYTLSVKDVTNQYLDDFSSWTDTTGAIAVGDSTAGRIEFNGDRDWFAVTLEAGKSYRIDLKGYETDSGSLQDPYLRGIHDAEGSLIDGTANDDGGVGSNSRLIFTAPESGDYYLSAAAYKRHEGTYTLSVDEVAETM